MRLCTFITRENSVLLNTFLKVINETQAKMTRCDIKYIITNFQEVELNKKFFKMLHSKF